MPTAGRYRARMADPVTLVRDGDVAVITLDDGKANALSFAVLDGLNAALAEARHAPRPSS